MRILKKLNLSMFTALLAVSLMGIACDSGAGNQPTGEGGPDISPDTVAATDVVADAATVDQVTEISATEESSVVIEPEANTVLEGSLDTELASTGGDTTNIEELLPVVDTTADVTGGDTGTTEVTVDTTKENKGETVSTVAKDETVAKEDKGETVSTAAKDEKVSAGTDPEVVISEIATEEVTTAKAEPEYKLETGEGKWFKEEPGQVTSDADAKSTRAKIAELRAQIKAIMGKFANKEITRDDAKAQIEDLREQIALLRDKIGNGGNRIEGIKTDWAYQDMFLSISKGEPGWYRLVVVAKNDGNLPDSYDRFSFNLTNESGDIIGSFDVKASDKSYHRGSIDFKLDQPAGSKLNIVWTNDYFVENKKDKKENYDANLNIKKVALKKIKAPEDKKHKNKEKHLNGDQFSHMDGRWFFDNQGAYTHWSGQEIGYTFENMEEGVYEVTIEARNQGDLPLPKDFKEFEVNVESDYDSGNVAIEANDKESKKGTVTMSFPEGDTTIYTTWTNDSHVEGKEDTNIKIQSISVKKVKDSNLTAYLLKTKPGNKVFILAAFLMISGVLLGIYMKNRSASSAS
ncbi:MAG TPA: hypothetical protein PK514_07285 [Spirochaetota bacterium]|nr:hypothetical protein [Spirochaetota bacterium]